MSILKNTTSVTRYKVSELEFNAMEAIAKLNQNIIKEVEMGDDLSFGWSSLHSPYDPNFDDMSFMIGQFLAVSMRIDKKSIPRTLLNKEIHLAENRERITKGSLLSKENKTQIKESTIKNLLAKTQAIPNTYDVVWDTTGELYLFSTTKGVRDIFEILMTETFDVSIRMIFPFTMSLKEFSEDAIADTQPTNFS